MAAVQKSLGILLFLSIVYGLKVVPDRVTTMFVNYTDLEYFKTYVHRYGRKSAYYLNMETKNYWPWGNNVTIHMIFNEYLHNEYRRSFVEMHFRMCDFFNEPFVGGMFKFAKVKCPIPTGSYSYINMTLPTENFPYVLPFEKARVDLFINKTNSFSMLYYAQVFCHFLKK